LRVSRFAFYHRSGNESTHGSNNDCGVDITAYLAMPAKETGYKPATQSQDKLPAPG
jgi:hypothetical protein